MMRSVTSLLSRKEPLASSEDIHRRPHRASCSDAVGLTDAADGAAAKRRCLRSRLLAAAIRAWMNWFWSLGEGIGGGSERRKWLLRRRSGGGRTGGVFWVPLDPIHYGPVYSWPRFVMAGPSSCSFVFASLLKKMSSHLIFLFFLCFPWLICLHRISLDSSFLLEKKIKIYHKYKTCMMDVNIDHI